MTLFSFPRSGVSIKPRAVQPKFIVLFEDVLRAGDVSTSGGRLFFRMFAAVAEFEHDLIVERTREGLEAARSRGKTGGRKTGVTFAANCVMLYAPCNRKEGGV